MFLKLGPRALEMLQVPPYLNPALGGILSESLNHVWTSQATLTMYEIEK